MVARLAGSIDAKRFNFPSSFSLLDIRIYMVSFPFRFKLSIGRVEQENVFSREVKYQCHASHDCADVSYQY